MRAYSMNINNKPYKVVIKDLGADAAELEINGKSYSVKLDELSRPDSVPTSASITSKPAVQKASSPSAGAAVAQAESSQTSAGDAGLAVIQAPIPGSILGIMCGVGDKITVGQPVIKMEAMKMENEIKAEIGGVVSAIKVNIGDSVNQGKDLIVVKKDV